MLNSGIIEVSGEHDTGKTSFALEAYNPEETVFVDDDIKGTSTVQDLLETGVRFLQYIPLTEMYSGKLESQKYKIAMGIIDAIPKEAKCIIWDTWTATARTFFNHVYTNQSSFRTSWSPMGKMKSGELWQETALHEATVLNRMFDNRRLVIIVNHLKDHFVENVRTGKQIPASSRTFDRVCRARFWLRHNPVSPIPIALVLKRTDEKYLENGRLRTRCVLPRKITPMPGDKSLWDAIERYYANPIDQRAPLETETPDEYELSILDGELTEEQKMIMSMAIISRNDESDEDIPYADRKAAAMDLRGSGKSVGDIAKELGMKVPDVVALLKD